MTDIVERLRKVIDIPCESVTRPSMRVLSCIKKALCEIERLRDQEKHCIEEIERLQLELQATKFCVKVHIAERNIARLLADRLEDENAKLRERLKK